MTLAENARELLIEKGFDPNYGARPMRRAVERYLEDPLAEALLCGTVKTGDKVRVTRKQGTEELIFDTSNKDGGSGKDSKKVKAK